MSEVLLGGGSLAECDHPAKFELMRKGPVTAEDLRNKVYSEKDPTCAKCKEKCAVE